MTKFRYIFCFQIIQIIIVAFVFQFSAKAQTTTFFFPVPQLKPAEIKFADNLIQIIYQGKSILSAKLEYSGESLIFSQLVDEKDGVINQVFKITSNDKPVHVQGLINSSEEGFPCESDKRNDALPMVRNSVGLSHNLLNNAVYDRRYDWLISVDYPVKIQITPQETQNNENIFEFSVTGREIIIRLRPYFYNKHKGLTYFEPWTYQVWQKPVAGWCSWFAYFRDIDEVKIKHTADILQQTLVPFGLEYLQIDDGYQQEPAGLSETWLKPNEKFPSGLENLSSYIHLKGMKPGIWTYASFHQEDFARKNPEYFVRDEAGNPAKGNWVGFVLDGSNQKTLDEIIKPIYRGLEKTGWEYFKVDALRHLRYEGYNSFPEYFDKKGIDRVEVYRDFVKTIRNTISKNNFMLACWGIRPELTGIVDGCRIGNDGFGYGGLAQYNSFNNVVWRNDPDHIELSETEAYRSTMVTSLCGALFMLTDKPEIYLTPIVEPAKRTLPVPFTLPGQIYDVDPSRSSQLFRVDSEMSGSGPRVFDADQAAVCGLYLLEINKPFENWLVLGRTDENTEKLNFADLGLNPEKEYLIFEFWTKQYSGSFTGSFIPGSIDTKYNCQVFCIRERLVHPQILATNRHISCGSPDLENVIWDKNTLSGQSLVVGGDVYEIYLTDPETFAFKSFTCADAEIVSNKKSGFIRKISLKSNESKVVKWAVEYGFQE